MTSSEALNLLKDGGVLSRVTLKELLDARGLEFIAPVVLREVELSADFRFVFFRGGFIAEQCRFRGRLSFAEGGHNDNGSFTLRGCTFEGPVDFYDCLFTGPFEVIECRFMQGTNLLGQPWANVDQFRVPPVISLNEGLLNLKEV